MTQKNRKRNRGNSAGTSPASVKLSRSKHWQWAVWLVAATGLVASGAWFANRTDPSHLKLTPGKLDQPASLAGSTGANGTTPHGSGTKPSKLVGTVQVSNWNAEWDALDNPTKDGWDTEAFHQVAKKQLKSLAEVMFAKRELSDLPSVADISLSEIVTLDFDCARLLPEDLHTVTPSVGLKVQTAINVAGKGTVDDEGKAERKYGSSE